MGVNKTMSEKLQRRAFLRSGSLLGLGVLGASAAQADCGLTPAQMEGPFYPVTRRSDENYDLTRLEGRAEAALGEAILVGGVVRDAACNPVAGAVVEIWQASASGRYDHPEDSNPAELDPNFQYWGRVRTGADGRYSFKTIYPGLYPGRTRHIHFRVLAPQHPTLTTQLYFEGEARNASDGIYRGLSAAQRRLVTTTLQRDEALGLRVGKFDITVGRGRGRVDGARLTPELD
jgi:protocatechuate 3,4-dioxygenase beta subunit